MNSIHGSGASFDFTETHSKDLSLLRLLLHSTLFILTLFTTTVAGVQWVGYDPTLLENFHHGLAYSIALLAILSAHEFGHYFAARYHGVKATLPYYIPFPLIPGVINFGTLGAVIRTKSPVLSRKSMFDIGVAGPIAGFVVSLFILAYGFATLPDTDYILRIHPNYDFGINADPTSTGYPLEFGQTILFWLFSEFFARPDTFFPPMSEIYHYPFLCVGWFGLFVTALNLIPIGQFDGGHIIFAMFGEKHRIIARWAFTALIILGIPAITESVIRSGIMLIGYEELPNFQWLSWSWSGWFIWAMISYFFVKLDHPPVMDMSPLSDGRMIVGYAAFVIFILSFSFIPFTIQF